MMEILATLLLIVAARLAHGNPDGAPIEACSTLTPQHESASELVCGADCPFRLTLQAIDSIQVMLDDGQLPMYSCDSEHTVLLHGTNGNETFRGFLVQPRITTDVFDPNASFVGEFIDNMSADTQFLQCDMGMDTATHVNNSEKTEVALIWQAPSRGLGQPVTFWLTVVIDTLLYYVKIKGLHMEPSADDCDLILSPPNEVPVDLQPQSTIEVQLCFSLTGIMDENITLHVSANSTDLSSPVSETIQFEADASANSLCSVVAIMLGDLTDPPVPGSGQGSGQTISTAELFIELTSPSVGVRVEPSITRLVPFGSCAVVGFSGCCTNGSCLGFPPNCYCNEACHRLCDCCPDIADINCAPPSDFTVGLSELRYTVEEGSFVEVCAQLGNDTQVHLQSEVEVIIMTAVSGSAEAGSDFEAVTQTLSLSNDSSKVCVELSAFNDSILEGEETLLVSLSSPNHSDAIVNPNQANVTITDSTVVSLTLEQSVYHVMEGDTSVRVCASFSETDIIKRTLLAVLQTQPSGSASATTDYTPLDQTLTFNSNASLCENVTINDDSVLEDSETFQINVSSSDPDVRFGSFPGANITITDDDVEIRFDPTVYNVNENEGLVEVILSVRGQRDITLNFTLEINEGSATFDNDYQHQQVPVSLQPPLKDSIGVNISLIDDTLVENKENFSVHINSSHSRLSVPVNFQEAEVYIVDDDNVTVGFSSPTYSGREDDGSLDVCIARSGDETANFTVMLAVNGITATDGADYNSMLLPTKITHNKFKNTDTLCYKIFLNTDTLLEGNERIKFSLSSDDSFVVFSQATAVFTIIDSTQPTETVINNTLMDVQDKVSSGNQTQLNLESISMSLNSVAEAIETDNITINEMTLDIVSLVVGELSEDWSEEVLQSSQNSSLMILTVVDSIGSSLLAQLNGSDQISSCQDGLFLLAKRVAPSSKGASDLSLNTDSNCARNSDSNVASVFVPKSLFDQDNEGISIFFVLFNSSSLFPDTSTNNLTVNSAVIGISINNYTQLSENITIHFQLQRSSNEVQCVFYDLSTNQWSPDGCITEVNVTGGVTCLCDHLTYFALQTSIEELDCGEQAKGDFVCVCNRGYQLQSDGKTCSDIDECINESTCQNAECTNLVGSFNCSCNTGFIKTANPNVCEDKNECTSDDYNDCHANATCTNLIGSYSCSCKKGYIGDGFICEDINECELIPSRCDERANCTNYPGLYECTCINGFSGSGKPGKCTGIPPPLVISERGSKQTLTIEVEPGRSLNLTCLSEGEHAGDVRWTNSNGSLVPLEQIQQGTPYGERPISLSGFSEQNLVVGANGIARPSNGQYKYTCTATNNNDNATFSINVTLQIPALENPTVSSYVRFSINTSLELMPGYINSVALSSFEIDQQGYQEFICNRLENNETRVECQFNNYNSNQSLNLERLREVLVNEGIVSPDEIITLSKKGFCDYLRSMNDEYGEYHWPETRVGEGRQLQCEFGPPNSNSTRKCVAKEMWSTTIDYSKCDTMITMMYQTFDVEQVIEETVVEMIREFAALVEMTDDPDDQSQRNFDVIVNVLIVTNTVVRGNDFNDTVLEQIVRSVSNIIDDLQVWQEEEIQMTTINVVQVLESVAESLAVNEDIGDRETVTVLEFMGNMSALVVERNGIGALQRNGREFGAIREGEGINTSSSAETEGLLASIQLPESLFSTGRVTSGTVGGRVGLVFSFFETPVLFPLANGTRPDIQIRTPVIGALLGGISNIEGLIDPITITLQLDIDKDDEVVEDAMCVSWDFEALGGIGNWTDRGCNTALDRDSGIVLCKCSHLTNFAALVDVCSRTECDCTPSGPPETALEVISYVGISLSIIGLILTIITMLVFSKLRSRDASKFHVQLSLALLGMLVVFVVGIDRTEVFEACVTVSVLIHYFTLVAVMWMGAEALLMFQKLVIVFVQITTRYIIIVSLVCWLAPLLPVIISVSIDPRFMVSYRDTPCLAPNVTTEQELDFCFIGEVGVLFGAFLVPILGILVFNSIVFVVVIRVLLKHTRKKYNNKNKDKQALSSAKRLLISSFGIMFLFGLSWVFGALTISSASLAFQYLFTIFTSFQGFFIFFFFCVLGKEARESWIQLLCRGRKLPWSTGSSSQQKTPVSTSGTESVLELSLSGSASKKESCSSPRKQDSPLSPSSPQSQEPSQYSTTDADSDVLENPYVDDN